MSKQCVFDVQTRLARLMHLVLEIVLDQIVRIHRHTTVAFAGFMTGFTDSAKFVKIYQILADLVVADISKFVTVHIRSSIVHLKLDIKIGFYHVRVFFTALNFETLIHGWPARFI
jgi:hypothetical protein